MFERNLPILPPTVDLETKRILKQLVSAHKYLSELKGYSETIPNKNILINAIIINESKDSSEIENIITTHDDLYREMSSQSSNNLASKEVENYRTALWKGFDLVSTNNILSINMIIQIQEIIEKNSAGIRKVPGTVLKNDKTGEIVYTPPVGENVIREYLSNLEKYINIDDEMDDLIKLAVIHYQFESIHPFYDGNGRTGRIINVLFLILKGLLDSPILYLSRFIIRNKDTYYHLLQDVRESNNWEEWIIFILKGIEEISKETLDLTKLINNEVLLMRDEIKENLPKIYSKELIEILFKEFYTKTIFVEKGLNVTRKTAVNYLKKLEEKGFLISEKIGKERIYQNKRLFDLVKNN